VNAIAEAAVETHEWLCAHNVKGFFIGGIAVQFWGEPRATLDVDVCVIVSNEEERCLALDLLKDFHPRISDAAVFAEQSRVVLLVASNGCNVDVSYSGAWLDEEAFERAVSVEILPGRRIPICSAEDLVVYKAVAGRAKDVMDIRGIVRSQSRKMDATRVRRLLTEYSNLTDDDEPLKVFEQLWSESESSAKD